MIILHYFVGRVEALAKPIGVNLRKNAFVVAQFIAPLIFRMVGAVRKLNYNCQFSDSPPSVGAFWKRAETRH